MLRISLPYVWSLAEALDHIASLDQAKENTRLDVMLALYDARAALEGLINGSVFAPTLRSCRPLGMQLLKRMEGFMDHGVFEDKIPGYEIAGIKQDYMHFKTAFLAELGTFPSYFVSQKGSHDTLSLLDYPACMFPNDLAEKVPEAMYDVVQSGKALCFETPTACGFHLFRVTEAVLRRYYSHVTGGSAQPKMRNIMVYVQAMRKSKAGTERILSVVEQLSKLHRNPIIHPEVALSLDEAIAIHGIARSVVTAMLSELPIVPQTTTATVPSRLI